MSERVSCLALPREYGRDALYGDIIPPTASGSLPSHYVHPNSLGDTLNYRSQQMKILAGVRREPRCGGRINAGDFKALSPRG